MQCKQNVEGSQTLHWATELNFLSFRGIVPKKKKQPNKQKIQTSKFKDTQYMYNRKITNR